MSVSTHRRAWLVRAATVATVVAAGLLGVAAPALAADVDVATLPLADFSPGQSQTLQVQVTNNLTTPGLFQVQVQGLPSDFTVSDPQGCDSVSGTTCTVSINNGASKNVSFKI